MTESLNLTQADTLPTPLPEIPALTKSYGVVITTVAGYGPFSPGGYSYGYNGSEIRFSRRSANGQTSIGFSQSTTAGLTAYHETPGGWRFLSQGNGVTASTIARAVPAIVPIEVKYVECRFVNLGQPYADAPAFLAIMNPRTGEQFRSQFLKTNSRGEARIYWENGPQYDYYPCIVRKETEGTFFPWNLDTGIPYHASSFHGDFETPGSVAFNTTYEYVLVEPNRPDFGITAMGHFQGSNVAFIQARWESLASCPGHACYILISFDRQRNQIVHQEQVTGTTGEFLAYTNTETELHIIAIDSLGREYANNWGVLTTPSGQTRSAPCNAIELGVADTNKLKREPKIQGPTATLVKEGAGKSRFNEVKIKRATLPSTNFVPLEEFFPEQAKILKEMTIG